MAKKTISGVSGVLGTLITSPDADKPETAARSKAQPSSPNAGAKRRVPTTAKTRTGRPPGRKDGEVNREKVTVWVGSGIIAEFRDWSWEERCHLGELVERALAHYIKRRK